MTKIAIKSGWVRAYDGGFLMSTEGSRYLSGPQQRWMADINKRIVHGLATEPFKYEPKPKRRKTETRNWWEPQ